MLKSIIRIPALLVLLKLDKSQVKQLEISQITMLRNRVFLYIREDTILLVERVFERYKYKYTKREKSSKSAENLQVTKKRNSLFSICEVTKKYYRALQSH